MLSRLRGFLLVLVTGCCWTMPVCAQSVTPTVGVGNVGTMVNETGSYTITGGVQQLNTLFHSFETFSPETTNVLFQLDGSQSTVEYVLGRVTGTEGSFIDGELKLMGGNSPDLFLMNPNGIVFGPDASLSLPGSFVASTATEVIFAGGNRFAATSSEVPMLTVSAPIGLQLSSRDTPASIQVNGSGHSLSQAAFISPVDQGVSTSELVVPTGETLALIGGEVLLEGGVLIADAGRIELAAVQQGQVDIETTTPGWQFTYDAAESFGQIDLANQSLIDASQRTRGADIGPDITLGAGDITLVGHDINLAGASVALIQNLESDISGSIRVQASGTLNAIGTDPAGDILTGFKTQTLGPGRGGNIELYANNISISEGAEVEVATYGTGDTGRLVIVADDTLAVEGFSSERPQSSTTVATFTVGAGNAGEMDIQARRLTITNGGNLTSYNIPSFVPGGNGNSGDVTIRVSERIEVVGDNNITQIPSSLTVITLSDAAGGDLLITAPQVEIRDGGRIGTTVFADGEAGSVTIEAEDFVEISGVGSSDFNQSLVIASANILDPFTRQLFGLPDKPSGRSGDILIETGRLSLSEGAQVTVRHDGTGDSGDLRIESDTVLLDQDSGITASTESGNGGNIRLSLESLLFLQNNSQISAEAEGTGDGGNLVIDAPIILGLGNSEIIANAEQGNGGNIAITAQSILGSAVRDQLTITASSEFGLNGTVEINNLTVDPGAALVELPQAPADADDQVTAACASSGDNQFIASGRGGLPTSPMNQLSGVSIWNDTRDLSTLVSRGGEALGRDRDTSNLSPKPSSELLEVNGWYVNDDGQVELLAMDNATDIHAQPVACLVNDRTV